MELIDLESIKNKIANGYEFQFSKYIEYGWNLFKKEWLLFSIYTLLMHLIITVSIITLIGPILLSQPLLMGYSIAAKKIENNEKLELNDFFGGLKSFSKFIPFSLIILLFSIVTMLPIFVYLFSIGIFANSADVDVNNLGASLSIFIFPIYFICFLVLMVFTTALFFTPYFLFYGQLSTKESMKLSFALVKKRMIYYIVFLMLLSFISSIGFYVCFVGLYASAGLVELMKYAVVKDLILDSTQTELEKIGIE